MYVNVLLKRFYDFFSFLYHTHNLFYHFDCRFVFTIVSYLIGVFIFATIVGKFHDIGASTWIFICKCRW